MKEVEEDGFFLYDGRICIDKQSETIKLTLKTKVDPEELDKLSSEMSKSDIKKFNNAAACHFGHEVDESMEPKEMTWAVADNDKESLLEYVSDIPEDTEYIMKVSINGVKPEDCSARQAQSTIEELFMKYY